MFDVEFQKDILNYIIQNKTSYRAIKRYIKKDYFTNFIALGIYNLIEKNFEKHNIMPSFSEAKFSLLPNAENQLEEEVQTNFIEDVYSRQTSTITKELLINYIHEAEVLNLSKELIDTKNTADVLRKLQLLENLKHGKNVFGFDPFSEEAIQNRKNVYEELYDGEPVPTGISRLDSKLRGGGLRPGDFMTIMGTTGGGKTALTLAIALNMVKQGKTVFYFVLDNMVAELLERIDANITGISTHTLHDNIDKAVSTLSAEVKQYKGKFRFVELEPHKYTPQWVKGHITELEEIHGQADVLIFDSCDLLTSSHHYDAKRHDLEKIYAEVRGLAVFSKKIVLNTTQSNRAGLAKDIIDLNNISEAYSKAFYCSVFATITMTTEDRNTGRAKVTLVKNTKGDANIVIPIYLVLSVMRAYDDMSSSVYFVGGKSKPDESETVLKDIMSSFKPLQHNKGG